MDWNRIEKLPQDLSQHLIRLAISNTYVVRFPIEHQNLTVSQYKQRYTSGTVPSFYRFRSITLNPLYDDAFS